MFCILAVDTVSIDVEDECIDLMLSSMLLTQCALDADTARFAYKH